MKRLLIMGATSDIARACARRFAAEGFDLILAAREPDRLKPDVKDLEIRFGIAVETTSLDILSPNPFLDYWNQLDRKPDGVLCAVGSMEGTSEALATPDILRRLIDTNFTEPAVVLSRMAADLKNRENGFLLVIGSVAGDRGRATNYPYGAPKAGLHAFLSGLRQGLNESGVHVMTIKPGFVRTRMTDGMDLPEKLVAEPDRVARDILRAWKKRKPVVYTPWFWRWILFIIRHIPESIFLKLKL